MSRTSWVPITGWSVGRCESCGRYVAVLTASDGSELRLRVTHHDGVLLSRGRHPAYAVGLRPLVKELATSYDHCELSDFGPRSVTLSAVEREGQRRWHVPVALALLTSDAIDLPLLVDESLFAIEGLDHFDDIEDVFEDFLAGVSPQDFAGFDARRR